MKNVDFNGDSYRWSLGVTVPILVAILISYSTSNNIEIYDLFIDTFCAAISIALFLLCVISKKSEYNYYYYLGISFFFLSIFSFLLNVAIMTGGIDKNSVFEAIMITKFQYSCIAIIISFYLLIKKTRLIKSMGINCIGLAMVFLVNYHLHFTVCTHDIIGGGYFIISSVILAIYSGYTLWKNRGWLGEKEVLYNYVYMGCIFVHHGLRYISTYNNEYYMEAGMVKYLAYYVIFMTMNKFVISKSLEFMRDDLIELSLREVELNKNISESNKLLIERKRDIQRGEEMYSKLIDSLSDGIIIFHKDKLDYINKAASKILGLEYPKRYYEKSIEEVLGEFLINHSDKVLHNKGVSGTLKVENIIQGECQYDLLSTMLQEDNRLIFIKDTTEIYRNRDIRKKYEDYLSEESVKNEFYSNISHELRTPINLIYSGLQLNEINLEDNLLEPIIKRNDVIRQSCLRLIRTINNFIDTNRISEGYLKPNMKIHNIIPLIENISLECIDYFEKLDGSLIFDPQEEEIYVECDKDMIERIMLNLLSNSLKYGEKGVGVLINVEEKRGMVIINLENNGYAIDKSIQPYIFDKFTKVNKSLNREREGSGLGLYLVKELLELQGGSISVISDENQGSKFVIEIPKAITKNGIEEEGLDFNCSREKVNMEFADIYL